MKYVKYRFYILSAGIIFFVFLLFAAAAISKERRNYQDKIFIVCKMISSEEILKNATELLKGKESPDVKKEKERLESYGYDLEKQNAFHREYVSSCRQIILFSVFLYFFCMIPIFVIYQKEKKKIKRNIETLNQRIWNYRNQMFEREEEFFTDFESEEMETLYVQIQSMSSSLQLLHEQVTKDKEDTKSLVTDISHQLKTPVAALKTSLEILQLEDLSTTEKYEFINRCNLLLKGIETLLEALIQVSRLETGIISIKRENSCLFDTLLDSINRIYLKAEQKQIQVEMEAEDELQELKIPQDKKWLSEAFINILDNAVKYSPSGKSVVLRMMKRATFVRIEIEDEGIGIPKCEYNQIFKRFYRGSQKEVKAETGSGVGLYLTREIISRHNGMIRVSSGKKNTGSLFIIQLPYVM